VQKQKKRILEYFFIIFVTQKKRASVSAQISMLKTFFNITETLFNIFQNSILITFVKKKI